MASSEEVAVHLDASPDGAPPIVGLLRRSGHGERADFTFAYDAGWLARREAFTLEPGLVLGEGDQRRAGGGLHAIFTDAAPDTWGRRLLERRESLIARREHRRPRMLDAWDFLLRVNDATRMGALRLRRPGDPTFIDADERGVPPQARLRDLEAAAARIDRGGPADGEEDAWLERLIAPGASLGGARPKVTFDRGDGVQWIAKFPAANDRRDVGAWEFVLSELARQAGVAVPEHELLQLGRGYHTYAARRFDRARDTRLLFASAMTLLDERDHAGGVSYLDIAATIELHGSPDWIDADLEQLFRRVVFNVACGHRDDHLRNHGFLHDGTGWRLSPAFDQNPMPEKTEHELALDQRTLTPDLDVVKATARSYRLRAPRAEAIVGEVLAAVGSWREVARRTGIGRDECDLVANAFLE